MIKLLLDAGLPRRAAADLRDRGWDVQHVADVGLGAATDDEILAAASAGGRAVVTHDHDFARLLFVTGASRPSVVLLRIEGLDRAKVVHLLMQLVPQIELELRDGAIVSVDAAEARVRPLPIT